MPCLPAWKKSLLIARRDKLITQLTAIETAIDEGLTNANISSYEFDSGDGKQKTSYRNLNEVFKARETLELELERTYNQLRQVGLLNMSMRR